MPRIEGMTTEEFDLSYYPAGNFRGWHHCPTCGLRQDTGACTCKDMEQAPEVVIGEALPEEPPADPALGSAIEQSDLWEERKDLE